MGTSWSRAKSWKRRCAFSVSPVLAGGGGEWMTISPQVLFGRILESLGRKTKVDVKDSEESPIGASDFARVYVDPDLIIEIRNLNPGVCLADMSREDLFRLLGTIDEVRGNLETWQQDWFKQTELMSP